MSNDEKTLVNTLTVLSERMKWVIRMGGVLILALSAGYAYQVNTNLAYGKMIEKTSTQMVAHIEEADKIHKIMIEKWIMDNDD